MRLRVPRQPAWKAATARRLRSATRTGMQSAVWMARSRPGSAVIWPSALCGCLRAASAPAAWTMRLEWNWRSEMSGVDALDVMASAKSLRLRRTVSRSSEAVMPRFSSPGAPSSAVGAAQAALARGEACPEPGKVPAGDWQPLDAIGGAARQRRGSDEFFRSIAGEARVTDGTRASGTECCASAGHFGGACLG